MHHLFNSLCLLFFLLLVVYWSIDLFFAGAIIWHRYQAEKRQWEVEVLKHLLLRLKYLNDGDELDCVFKKVLENMKKFKISPSEIGFTSWEAMEKLHAESQKKASLYFRQYVLFATV